MENHRVGTTIYIDKEIREDIRLNPFMNSLSDWINEEYTKQFLYIPSKVKRMEYISQLLEEAKIDLQKAKEEQKFTPLISELALKWIKNEGTRYLNKGNTFDSVLRIFNEKFEHSLSRKQFRLLINKIKIET